MPQSVFDSGDPITSRLRLGVTPDGTTNVTVTVRRPDGGLLSGLIISAWGGAAGDEKTVQWYATDDGSAGGTITPAYTSGDWLAVWRVTGTGASVSPKIYSVYPLPGTYQEVAWVPFLSMVADYVPWSTVALDVPGGDTFYGTYTGGTYPTDEQAVRLVQRVARPIAERWPALPATLHELARSYTSLRAAASVARGYARNADDVAAADALDRQADALWTTLVARADDTDESPTGTGQVPVYSFPEPVTWGDSYL